MNIVGVRDLAAVSQGYTREVAAEGTGKWGGYELSLLVKPDDDLEGDFKAWDLDEQEWITVNGDVCLIHEPEDFWA